MSHVEPERGNRRPEGNEPDEPFPKMIEKAINEGHFTPGPEGAFRAPSKQPQEWEVRKQSSGWMIFAKDGNDVVDFLWLDEKYPTQIVNAHKASIEKLKAIIKTHAEAYGKACERLAAEQENREAVEKLMIEMANAVDRRIKPLMEALVQVDVDYQNKKAELPRATHGMLMNALAKEKVVNLTKDKKEVREANE